MRAYHSITLAIICSLSASIATTTSAEVLTYKIEGVVTGGFPHLGPTGSDIVGYFSYEDNLPVRFSIDEYYTSYGFFSFTLPPDIYFQIYGESHSIFSTKAWSRYSVYNDYGIDNPSINTFDSISITGSRLSDETGFNLPPNIELGVFLRDTDYSVFDSTDMPTEIPPLTEFELPAFTINTGPFADVTSITRINNGDLDGDGFVGINDLNLVLTHWNQDATLGDRLSGNVNNDTFVGINDLNTVLSNWNASAPPNATANIPEPATLLTLLCLGSSAHTRRR